MEPHNPTKLSTIRHTTFFTVYGSKAVLPADLTFRAPRLMFKNITKSRTSRLEEIETLEEE